ncbi:MAG: rhodanese-like domain-containing protein [Bacteroidales bacterium]|nr:rhodanese-like domain-containing protein [Bacteroidales bacterium]
MKHFNILTLLIAAFMLIATPITAQKAQHNTHNNGKNKPEKTRVENTNKKSDDKKTREESYTPSGMTKEQRRQWNAANGHKADAAQSKNVMYVEQEPQGIVYISQEEAQQIIDKDKNAVLVDVRPRKEYKNGHLEHAICLPYEYMAENNVHERLPKKGQLIMVYCRSGQRSVKAAARLQQLGYRNVKVVTGILMLTNPVVKTKK